MNFNIEGEHTSWLKREREKGPALHLLLFHPAQELGLDLDDVLKELGLDLDDDVLLQAKNLINQMLTVNPAKRIRAEEVFSSDLSHFLFSPNKVGKMKFEEKINDPPPRL